MIDVDAYRKMHPNESASKSSKLEEESNGESFGESDQDPDENFLMTLPPNIEGFGIQEKKWSTRLVVALKAIANRL